MCSIPTSSPIVDMTGEPSYLTFLSTFSWIRNNKIRSNICPPLKNIKRNYENKFRHKIKLIINLVTESIYPYNLCILSIRVSYYM